MHDHTSRALTPKQRMLTALNKDHGGYILSPSDHFFDGDSACIQALMGASCVEGWSGKGQTIPAGLDLEPRGSVLWMIQ